MILSGVVLVAFLVGTTFGVYLSRGGHFDPAVNVYFEVTKGEASGVSSSLASGNLITDIGEAFARDAVLNIQSNATAWAISLSNSGTPATSWTQLESEVAANGFTRAAGGDTEWINSGDYAFNLTKTFTASGTQQLQIAGCQWSTTSMSDNNLFAVASFTQTTFNSGDTLTITWIITFNAN